MRRTLAVLVAVTLGSFALVATSNPTSTAKTACTQTGTPKRDILVGGKGRDILCSKKGADYVHGDGDDDILKAGKGPDTAVGSEGRDVLKGGPGNDRLFAVDGRGGEHVIGGKGADQCFYDPGDHPHGCETRYIGSNLNLIQALETQLRQVMIVADVALSSPTTTVTVTVPGSTVVQTVTAVLPPKPQCTPNPVTPPPNC